jgi:hypothetical protein
LAFAIAILCKSAVVPVAAWIVLLDVLWLRAPQHKGVVGLVTSGVCSGLVNAPYFLLSTCGALFAIAANKQSIPQIEIELNTTDTFLRAAYSISWYLIKTFVPTDLTTLYPFPTPFVGLGRGQGFFL